jgi:DNA-binding transcriptional ArsR family regulator
LTVATSAVFRVLADGTRRALLDLLLTGERSATELSAHFPASQQAVSLHLQALRRAALVEVRKDGRFRRYRLRAAPIREVFEWSEKYRPFFDPYGHAWLFTERPGRAAQEAAKPRRKA